MIVISNRNESGVRKSTAEKGTDQRMRNYKPAEAGEVPQRNYGGKN